ncbi:MAG: deoxyguanosinetriphosphate triphosphohydrolase [Candidatus Hydrogenedentota bacterium]|nr:MAG: deoxyguanosinetriphosphate triphosphohydrolase [Candidatus Hydrogenedentota bacterium]
MSIREMLERREHEYLSPRAAFSDASKGRRFDVEECPYRTRFQRDRDRIVHSKSFRRLKHKTQVFLSPTGDHYRTRLTHTLEVAQIARTISRALCLNEDLTEAIALGHDLGHTPFGHAGEAVLNELFADGFAHNEQSLRIVDELENGKGLNLTFEVRDGIRNHSKGSTDILEWGQTKELRTLEGEVVRISDSIAYINHDIDDALRSGLVTEAELPADCVAVLGDTPSHRIDAMVADVVCGGGAGTIKMSAEILEATNALRNYLYEHVYPRKEIQDSISKAKKILKEIYYFLVDNPAIFLSETRPKDADENIERLVVDFVAGMTDRYALDFYKYHFLPKLEI